MKEVEDGDDASRHLLLAPEKFVYDQIGMLNVKYRTFLMEKTDSYIRINILMKSMIYTVDTNFVFQTYKNELKIH